MPRPSHTVRLPSGQVIEYGEYGDLNGSPVLFFHGWPSSQRMAEIMDPAAKKLNCRIIAPNRPGIGKSTPIENWNLISWAPLVLQFAETLGLRSFSVLGVSGGGPYALAVAAELPDQVISAGMVSSAPPLADFDDRQGLHPAYRILIRMLRHSPWMIPPTLAAAKLISKCPPWRFPMSLILKTLNKPDKIALCDKSVSGIVMRGFWEAAAGGTEKVISDAEVYLQKWDIDFEAIQCPSIFWHGEQDRNIPARMTTHLASQVPGAEMRLLPDDGHFSPCVNLDEEILQVLLASHPGR